MTGHDGDERSNEWDPDSYDADVGFVAEYGESVLDLLDPRPGDRVLDLGCGTGHLTADIAEAVGPEGAAVGIDQSPEMVAEASETYPEVAFATADAREFDADALLDAADPTGTGGRSPDPVDRFDAVFSNAALHWIQWADQRAVAERVADALVPGGRFVAELGARGNVATVVDAVVAELESRGHEAANPWYFPTVGEHATVLERAGFEVRTARLFDRPTPLEGPDGLRNWLDVFGDSLFAPLSADEEAAVVSAVEDRLRGDLYDADAETWTADYRRLRFLAVRL